MSKIRRPSHQVAPGSLGAIPEDLQPPDSLQDVLAEAKEREGEFRRLRERVDRIVVLMLENRSFDHLLGWIGPERGGLQGDETNPGPADDPGPHRVFQTSDTALEFDPPHAIFRAVRDQVHRGAMDGFVKEFARKKEQKRGWRNAEVRQPMAFYGSESLAAYKFLAENHLVCARYFSSAPSGTWVNRMFLYAGTSGGLADAPKHPVRIEREYQERMPKRFLVDLLDEHGANWGIYAHDVAWMRIFREQNLPESRVHDFRGRFADHCASGELPKVVFVDPNAEEGLDFRANDDHVPIDLLEGQQLVRKVYTALLTLPDPTKTALVITYDEHGGFYDHVPPPPARGWQPAPYYSSVDPLPEEGVSVNDPFRRYGVRVPCFVVSPFVPAGAVVTDEDLVFDHLSLHASIHRRFLPEDVPFLSARVAAAHTLGRLLTRRAPRRSLPQMPDVSRRARTAAAAPPRSPLDRPPDVDEVDADESMRSALRVESRRHGERQRV
jgi:phospholipase C